MNTLQTKRLAVSRSTTIANQDNITLALSSADRIPATASSGRRIVEEAYRNSFEVFESCAEDEPFSSCLQAIQQNLAETPQSVSGNATDNSNTTTPAKDKPWWFHTMVRDALPKNNTPSPLFGFWHELTFSMPNNSDSNSNKNLLKMCSMEKIGTKQWRKVQCKVNHPEQTNLTGQPCNVPNDELPETYDKNNPHSLFQHAHQFVFLRDPLERFLSGFLDKCKKGRKSETHCEPLEVFHDSDRMVEGFVEHKRAFFEAYVDTLPLTWNMHFFPLSFYCDGLFRHLHEYSFVGHMGPNFYEDVHRFGQIYPQFTRLHSVLDEVFHLEKYLTSSENTTSQKNVGVETAAASYVKEYYTGRTVRRVLEYMSIDYVRLGLSIPAWAQEMLDEDDII